MSWEFDMGDHFLEDYWDDIGVFLDDGLSDNWLFEPQLPAATKWKTRDGRVLVIAEMETSHLENCIRMMDRAYAADPDLDIKASPAYRGIQLELERRKT